MDDAPTRPFVASDRYTWHYRRFVRSGPVRGTLIGLHGIQSHGGWYSESCDRLAQQGFLVEFLDRRGCGTCREARGDTPSFRRLLDDIAEFATERPQPRFVMGISWGGKLAVGLTRRHPGLVDGLILVAPGLCPRVRPGLGERLRIIASRFLRPQRLFPIPLNEPELFTANPARQQFIHDDALSLREATARLMFESGRMDVYLRFAARHVTVPVLLLLAEHDRIIDNAATRRYLERFATADRTVTEYAGAHHTLEFEQGGPPFVNDVLTWLERHEKAKSM